MFELKIVLKKSMLVEEGDLKATATIKKCLERQDPLILHVYRAVDMDIATSDHAI